MPTSFPFSEAKVKALPLPAGDREYHKDTKFPGLQICVTAAGRGPTTTSGALMGGPPG